MNSWNGISLTFLALEAVDGRLLART